MTYEKTFEKCIPLFSLYDISVKLNSLSPLWSIFTFPAIPGRNTFTKTLKIFYEIPNIVFDMFCVSSRNTQLRWIIQWISEYWQNNREVLQNMGHSRDRRARVCSRAWHETVKTVEIYWSYVLHCLFIFHKRQHKIRHILTFQITRK